MRYGRRGGPVLEELAHHEPNEIAVGEDSERFGPGVVVHGREREGHRCDEAPLLGGDGQTPCRATFVFADGPDDRVHGPMVCEGEGGRCQR